MCYSVQEYIDTYRHTCLYMYTGVSSEILFTQEILTKSPVCGEFTTQCEISENNKYARVSGYFMDI